MIVQEVMTPKWDYLSPNDTLQQASNEMLEHDFGFLPIQKSGKLVGVITDRDIAIRGVAKNMSPNTTLNEVLTENVITIHEEDDVTAAAQKMEENKVRRLVVLNGDEKITGVVSLGDIATHCNDNELNAEIIHAVSEK